MGVINWMRNLGSNTLYFPGCLSKVLLKEEIEHYKEIFNVLDIPFIMLSEREVCCGLPVLNAGYKKESRILAKKNLEVFKKNHVSKIICSCAMCYYMFKIIYPKLLPNWDIEVEHVSVSILEGIKNKGINMQESEYLEPITYHDSCHLGRLCGVYEEPRAVLRLLGAQVLEMKTNREEAMCCGASGGMIQNFNEVARQAAQKRIADAEESSQIISACSLCYYNFQSVSNRSLDFSSFVLRKLKESLT